MSRAVKRQIGSRDKDMQLKEQQRAAVSPRVSVSAGNSRSWICYGHILNSWDF